MTLNLEAKSREITGKENFKIREAGKIPAVVYGHGLQSKNIEIDYLPFEKLYREAGQSTLVDLTVDGQAPAKVLIADVQFEPLKGRISHIDLHQIRMDEKVRARIAIELIGESQAVKAEGGSLVHSINELEISCLPAELIREITVDVSVLKTFEDVIKIKDLSLPSSIEIIGHEPEDIVVSVSRIMEEKVETPVPVVEGAEGAVEGEAAAANTGAAEAGADKSAGKSETK